MAETGAKLRRLLDGGLHIRVRLHAIIVLGVEGDLQTLLSRRLDTPDGRQHRLFALHLGEVHERRAVAHGTADAMLHADIARQIAPAKEDAATARLQAENAAARCRNADRAAAIRRMSERDRRRAARRAARRMLEIPGIVARAEQQRFRGGEQAELRRVALADHDEARLLIGCDERIGFLRDIFREEARAGRGARAREIVEILHEVRHTGEGALREIAFRGVPRAVIEFRDDRVYLAVHLFDPLDTGIDQFERREFAFRDQPGLPQRIHFRKFRRGKRRTEPRTIGAGNQSRRRRRFQECPPGEIHAHHHFLHLPALQGAVLVMRRG